MRCGSTLLLLRRLFQLKAASEGNAVFIVSALMSERRRSRVPPKGAL